MKKLFTFLFMGVFCISGTCLAQTNTFPSSGNVGIGTTNPEQKFHVGGLYGKWLFNHNGRRLELHTTDETVEHYPWIGFYDHTGARGAYFGNGKPGQYIDLRLENSTNFVVTGGKVGIGTRNPQSRLEVTGSFVTRNQSSQIVNGDVRMFNPDGAGAGFLIRPYDDSFNGGSWNWKSDFGYREDRNIWYAEGGFEVIRGNVGIGTTNPSSKLTINGTAKAEEVIVEENIGADFVFEEDYPLPELSDLEAFIRSSKHLPEIPSAEDMKENGVKVGDLQMKLLQKIEELTLYVIELKKENHALHQKLEKGTREKEKRSKELFQRIERLEKRLRGFPSKGAQGNETTL